MIPAYRSRFQHVFFGSRHAIYYVRALFPEILTKILKSKKKMIWFTQQNLSTKMVLRRSLEIYSHNCFYSLIFACNVYLFQVLEKGYKTQKVVVPLRLLRQISIITGKIQKIMKVDQKKKTRV